jgi:hypothetical protein
MHGATIKKFHSHIHVNVTAPPILVHSCLQFVFLHALQVSQSSQQNVERNLKCVTIVRCYSDEPGTISGKRLFKMCDDC